ncbi:hypothetical protein N8Z47_03280 [Salibacteraceae bacterium]|nr:hypothetical protein [Salibacteraceae bacterium]
MIIAFSICSHLSHIPIFGILLTLTFIINIIFQKKSQLFEFKRFYELFIILIISVLLIPSVNYLVDGKFRLDNSHNAFAVNHLSEMGILKDFLNEECIQGNEYLMCQYIDDIGTCHLLWDAESPMKKTGGITANAADFDRIMKEVYTNPIFLKRILWASIPNGIQQFRNFRPTVMVAQLEGSAPYGQFQWRFKESLHDYLSSRQNQNTLNTSIVAYIQPYIVYSSLLFLLWVLTTVKNWKTKKAQLIRSCTI